VAQRCIQTVKGFAIDVKENRFFLRYPRSGRPATQVILAVISRVDKKGNIKIRAKRVFDPAEVYSTAANK
jgi:hypothetical protein